MLVQHRLMVTRPNVDILSKCTVSSQGGYSIIKAQSQIAYVSTLAWLGKWKIIVQLCTQSYEYQNILRTFEAEILHIIKNIQSQPQN